MVEMHLLMVNVDFQSDPIYIFGVVTSFDRFMQGYRPQQDRESIFNALCKALEADPQQYRQNAEWLEKMASSHSGKEMVDLLSLSVSPEMEKDFQGTLQAIANNPKFKYSRLFAIGLFTLLEQANPDLVKNENQRHDALKKISAALHLPEEKIKKDLDLYRSNLEKMTQARIVIEDMLAADRKKREQRNQEKGAVAAPPNSSDEAPSNS